MDRKGKGSGNTRKRTVRSSDSRGESSNQEESSNPRLSMSEVERSLSAALQALRKAKKPASEGKPSKNKKPLDDGESKSESGKPPLSKKASFGSGASSSSSQNEQVKVPPEPLNQEKCLKIGGVLLPALTKNPQNYKFLRQYPITEKAEIVLNQIWRSNSRAEMSRAIGTTQILINQLENLMACDPEESLKRIHITNQIDKSSVYVVWGFENSEALVTMLLSNVVVAYEYALQENLELQHLEFETEHEAVNFCKHENLVTANFRDLFEIVKPEVCNSGTQVSELDLDGLKELEKRMAKPFLQKVLDRDSIHRISTIKRDELYMNLACEQNHLFYNIFTGNVIDGQRSDINNWHDLVHYHMLIGRRMILDPFIINPIILITRYDSIQGQKEVRKVFPLGFLGGLELSPRAPVPDFFDRRIQHLIKGWRNEIPGCTNRKYAYLEIYSSVPGWDEQSLEYIPAYHKIYIYDRFSWKYRYFTSVDEEIFELACGVPEQPTSLNPLFVFETMGKDSLGYDDYMSFLCGVNGSAPLVLNYTGQNCWLNNTTVYGPDLNLPSITISKLNQSRVVQRTVQNIAGNETYSVCWSAPYGVSVSAYPTHFTVANGERQVLSVVLNATVNSSVASFGSIGLFGDQGHVVSIPLSVIVKISSNNTVS